MLVRKQPNFVKEFSIPLLGLRLLLPSEILLFLISGILVLEVHILGVLVWVLQQYSLVLLDVIETQTAFINHKLEFAVIQNV